MNQIDILAKGHKIRARELGIALNDREAESLAYWGLNHCEVATDRVDSYGASIRNKTIHGDVYYLTKLYVPEDYKGKGRASKLLDQLPKTLLKAVSLTRVR